LILSLYVQIRSLCNKILHFSKNIKNFSSQVLDHEANGGQDNEGCHDDQGMPYSEYKINFLITSDDGREKEVENPDEQVGRFLFIDDFTDDEQAIRDQGAEQVVQHHAKESGQSPVDHPFDDEEQEINEHVLTETEPGGIQIAYRQKHHQTYEA
jgi:hypothetical protein